MSGEAKPYRFWTQIAWIIGSMAVMDLAVAPLYRAAPASVKYAILTVAAIALAALLVWLIRAAMRD